MRYLSLFFTMNPSRASWSRFFLTRSASIPVSFTILAAVSGVPVTRAFTILPRTRRFEFSKGLWNTIVKFDVRYRYADGLELHYRLDRPHVRFEGTDGWIEVR